MSFCLSDAFTCIDFSEGSSFEENGVKNESGYEMNEFEGNWRAKRGTFRTPILIRTPLGASVINTGSSTVNNTVPSPVPSGVPVASGVFTLDPAQASKAEGDIHGMISSSDAPVSVVALEGVVPAAAQAAAGVVATSTEISDGIMDLSPFLKNPSSHQMKRRRSAVTGGSGVAVYGLSDGEGEPAVVLHEDPAVVLHEDPHPKMGRRASINALRATSSQNEIAKGKKKVRRKSAKKASSLYGKPQLNISPTSLYR